MRPRETERGLRALRGACAALVALLWGAPAAGAIDIPANQWVKQAAPQVTLLPGFPGVFGARGWNHLQYDPAGQRMVLYDGYADATRPYSIYANALWTYDDVAVRLSLETVSNWTRQNGETVPLPENTTNPTPWDRHSYSCITVVPDLNRLYMWGGANSSPSITNGPYGDTWTYDFSSRSWREIVTVPHPYNTFEQTMVYDASARKIVLFAGATSEYGSGGSWTFDVDRETWKQITSSPSPSGRSSQSMVYDPGRRVSWLFGGGRWPDPGNDLWAFNAATETWEQVQASGSVPPPRRFAALAYDSRHDIILMWGGIRDDTTRYNDTWVFHASTRTWQQLFPSASPPVNPTYAEDLAYDPVNDVFVLHNQGEFWLYRYGGGSTDTTPPSPPSGLTTQ